MTRYYKGFLIVVINGTTAIYKAGLYQGPAASPANAMDWIDGRQV